MTTFLVCGCVLSFNQFPWAVCISFAGHRKHLVWLIFFAEGGLPNRSRLVSSVPSHPTFRCTESFVGTSPSRMHGKPVRAFRALPMLMIACSC